MSATKLVTASPATAEPILRVSGLQVRGLPSLAPIIDDISIEVSPGEILGVVGESGSGKTTLGLALLRYCKDATEVSAGTIEVSGMELASLSQREVRQARGRIVGYIPQSPASALNPALRIRTQIGESLEGSRKERTERIRQVLREVALPDDDQFLARYPHQLSGGQQQRVAIAMAFAPRPELIVLDEPTTGLDVGTQKHVLATIRQLAQQYGTAAIYISHDMAVVAELADWLAVMYSGRIVEWGRTLELLAQPQHPYTAGLFTAVPDLELKRPMLGIPGGAPSPLDRPEGCAFAPRCEFADATCVSEDPPQRFVKPDHMTRCYHPERVALPTSPPLEVERTDSAAVPALLSVQGVRASYGRTEVLTDVSLDVAEGECVALLGESGSGKSTLAHSIAGLHRSFTGEIRFDGQLLAADSFRRTKQQRHQIQYVFQNPYESLNPRRRVRELIAQPIRALDKGNGDVDARVAAALEQAALRPDHAYRLPAHLSGGERQRVAIARALAVQPRLLICDEITSALDVSVQSSILELLRELQQNMGLALLFITHNIAVVRNIAQKVAILEKGVVVEYGDVEEIFANPQHPYTRSLIADTPNFQLEMPDPRPTAPA